MSRTSTLILLGVLVFISPFSGLPLSWLSWLLPILGIAIVIAGLSLRQSNVREQVRASVQAAAQVPVEPESEVESEQEKGKGAVHTMGMG